MKTTSDGAHVTSDGRPFQIRAPAIGNALRPIVDSWTETVRRGCQGSSGPQTRLQATTHLHVEKRWTHVGCMDYLTQECIQTTSL